MILFTLLVIVVLFAAPTEAQHGGNLVQPGSYMAFFPSHIDTVDYTIYFKMLRPVAYETIEARLLYSNYTEGGEKNVTKASGSLSLSSGSQDGTITLKVPDELQSYGRYHIYIRGRGVLNFENLTSVDLAWRRRRETEKDYIFIQTDKAAYKTGQKVRYRVFVVDKEMKPRDPLMNIDILDPMGHKIKEHVNISNILGFSGELQLSDQPILGFWKIRVIIVGEDTQERIQFQVHEYVLPKFEVKVKLPDFGTTANPELKGTVTAKYTYGKPVQGHVTLRVTKSNAYWWFYEPRAIQTEFEIDGEADFSIATDTLLKFDPSLKYDTLRVEANVTEKETGEVRLAHSTVSFHERPVKLVFADGDEVFKPGFKYTTFIKVTQPDGRPLTSSGERVRIGVTYFTDQEAPPTLSFRPPNSPSSNLMEFISPFPGGDVLFMPEMFLSVPRDGMIKLELDIPKSVATGHIDVSLREEKASKNIQRFRTISKSYLHLELKSSFVEVGKQAEFSVRSNVRPNGKVTYHILKNKEIIETHYTHIASVYQKNTFYVTMTSKMVPECVLLAYFYNDKHNEIIADAIRFSVQTSFQNDVSLRFDRTKVSPASNVSLNIRADPGSQVFVLAVDKSVILHKSGNDITQRRIYDKLGIFERPGMKYQDSYLSQRISANNPIRVFMRLGLQVMSDASFYDFDLWSMKMGMGTQFMTVDSPEYDSSESFSGYNMNFEPMVRKEFPETWLWTNESVSSTGNVVMTATIPDTITDWVATGFALNKHTGLGVAPIAANVTAYLPFFVSLHLPFSIVSGEIAVVQALVFNYYPHDMYVTVSLKNSSDNFLGIVVDRYGKEEETKDQVKKCIMVKSNDVSSAYFTIKALKIGTINLEVEASSPRGRDTVLRQLIVRPPGEQEEQNIPVLISLDNGGNFQKEIPISYPLRIVPDSQRIQITVIGDIFGPSMDHLDQLIKIPYGCGEQNMVLFAPAVFAARYLKFTNRYSDKMKARVEQIMEIGYQKQLTYQRMDGSFSAFGWRDPEGSLWLTAFVLKSFAQASEFTYIDPKVVEKGVKFIIDNQNKDGSFNSTGFVHNKAMQGGSMSNSKTLAAYVLIAMKEIQDKEIMANPNETAALRKAILSAWSFVQQNSARLTDDYELAIAAFASAQMSRGGSTDMINRLDRSIALDDSDGTKHWRHSVKSTEIEIAGYVLLTHAKENNVNGALPVLRWLVQQRSPYGGFLSTQDTVVALQGMADIASQMYSSDVSMTLEFDYGSDTPKRVTLNPENMDVLQFVDVPEDIRGISVSANGRGTGLIEISIFYNVLEEDRDPSFDLMVTTNGTEVNKYTLKACTRWLGSEDSGMVLLDIGFPSGFKPVLSNRLDNIDVAKTEMDEGRLVLYYDYLDEEIRCYTVDVIRESTIGRSQPASVRVYTYYDTEKSATKFYLPNTLKKNYICDYCGVECGCGFDPDAVPMERCLGIMSRYLSVPSLPKPREVAVYPGFTGSKTKTTTKTTTRTINDGNRIIYPAVIDPTILNTEIHRVIEPLEPISMKTIRQRLQPNRWHRGQSIPVTFTRTTKVRNSFPVMTNNFPTISRSWNVINS